MHLLFWKNRQWAFDVASGRKDSDLTRYHLPQGANLDHRRWNIPNE
jgi:hypothetical protein